MAKTKVKTEHIKEEKPPISRIANVGAETISNVSFDEYPGTYSADLVDPYFDIEKFKLNLNVIVYPSADQDELEFDLVGVDSSIANAIRRILIAEIPTVAIEKVYILNNTSIVQDEILAQRLGLIPIFIDPRRLSAKGAHEEANDMNTIVFQLKVKCELAPKVGNEPRQMINENVYSSMLQWIPQGNQGTEFQDSPVRPVHPDILIAKLRPGQELDLELHCEKNLGKEHAKWSPVATATYRLLPVINITSPIEEEKGKENGLVEKFISCFPPGVIAKTAVNGQKSMRAVVENPRLDTMTREVLRHPEFAHKVELGRRRDYFIFNIESTGILSPYVLVNEALDVLAKKSDALLTALDALRC
ncbi:DNA-directed RNA polymerases I and III subunit RPAC1 [Mitosporidium daphniae]